MDKKYIYSIRNDSNQHPEEKYCYLQSDLVEYFGKGYGWTRKPIPGTKKWKIGGKWVFSKDSLPLIKEHLMTEEEYCEQNHCIRCSEMDKRFGKGWRKADLIEYWEWKNVRYMFIDDIPKIEEFYSKSPKERMIETKEAKKDAFCEEHDCVRARPYNLAHGKDWIRKGIVEVLYLGDSSFIYKKDVPKLEAYFALSKDEKRENTMNEMINDYCEKNNCMTIKEACEKFGERWYINKLVPTWDWKGRSFISKKDLQKIIEYNELAEKQEQEYGSLSVGVRKHNVYNFAEENDCTPASDLEKIYGTGWRQARILEDKMLRYQEYWLVPNKYIHLIKEYTEIEGKSKKTRQAITQKFAEENDCVPMSELNVNTLQCSRIGITEFLTYNNTKFIKNSDVEKLKAYRALPYSKRLSVYHNRKVKEFCEKNDCVPLLELKEKYGRRWWEAKIVEPVTYRNSVFIYKKDIPKIEEYCSNRERTKNCYSQTEKFLVDWIEGIYDGECLENQKRFIYPYEVDLQLPEKKVAVEFNGIYWHSIESGKEPEYHFIKTGLCKEQGYRLIHIWEDEISAGYWERIQNYLKWVLTPKYIENAHGVVREISAETASTFNKKYCLNKNVKIDNALGLFYNDNLVSVMTFKQYDNYLRISSHATKADCPFKNPTKMLFNYFVENNEPTKIKVSCDMNKFTGETWEKLNFTLESKISPYTNKRVIKRKIKNIDELKKFRYNANNFSGTIYGVGIGQYVWEK